LFRQPVYDSDSVFHQGIGLRDVSPDEAPKQPARLK